ncbi:hypothetical protein HBZS_123370 [Helicobacter bizzozeronii CCUG 35545]|nr:hypothetical protein HBZS_123370 [Helicobacter bizzozeronii CCUG 35545]
MFRSLQVRASFYLIILLSLFALLVFTLIQRDYANLAELQGRTVAKSLNASIINTIVQAIAVGTKEAIYKAIDDSNHLSGVQMKFYPGEGDIRLFWTQPNFHTKPRDFAIF